MVHVLMDIQSISNSKMPPEISTYQYSVVTPSTPLLSPLSQKRRPLRRKGVSKMKFTKKRLIPFLVCILSIASVIRLVKIAKVTSSSTQPLLQLQDGSRFAERDSEDQGLSRSTASILTEKEMRFLGELVSEKAPCNLLFFGIEDQYISLASVNAGGLTIFLEDEAEKLNTIKTMSNNTNLYKLEYSTIASDAYKLLKHARKQKNCSPSSCLIKASKCKLRLKKLPNIIYETKWDVIIVDGPCGHKPDCPGRMASIYTASVLARNATNFANVLVHDVDRMIEKWFSWEFLCDSNLVSSKGKFWNFRIAGQYNATEFCSS